MQQYQVFTDCVFFLQGETKWWSLAHIQLVPDVYLFVLYYVEDIRIMLQWVSRPSCHNVWNIISLATFPCSVHCKYLFCKMLVFFGAVFIWLWSRHSFTLINITKSWEVVFCYETLCIGDKSYETPCSESVGSLYLLW